jgi:large subunit ribosomal protein L16
MSSLVPRKTKYRKAQKGNLPNKARTCSDYVCFGQIALKTLEFGILTSQQLDAAKKVVSKKIKKKGKVWMRVFSHLPKTKKPVEVRMGKGKGAVDSWVAKIKPGTILFEIEGVSLKMGTDIFFACSQKLPIKCKVIIT